MNHERKKIMYDISNVCRIEDKEIKVITIKNNNNMVLKLLNYGATIIEILVPNKEGIVENVVLTYENLKDYLHNPSYFGATIGRTAGRIADGRFQLDGVEYLLQKNFGKSHGHGGGKGFSFQVWEDKIIEKKNETLVEFRYTSRDMEEGYPGNLDCKVTYKLTNDNKIIIQYEGRTDQRTLCNLTNHTYFNLSGNYKHKVTEQYLRVKSNEFLELDQYLIPTGRRIHVQNTPMDFRKEKLIGKDIEADDPQLKLANGYDHPWILSKDGPQIELYDPSSGRKMLVTTSYPSVVIYTYNYPNNERLKYDKVGKKYDGICFETQYEPDGIHHKNFHWAILDPDKRYYEKTEFKFLVV